MKRIIYLASISFFTWSCHVFAVTLDTTKFKLKAQEQLERSVGAENLVGISEVIFQDGASSLDSSRATDNAYFAYTSELKAGLLPANSKIAYRLLLINGSVDIVGLTDHGDGKLIAFNPSAGLAVMKPGGSRESDQAAANELMKRLANENAKRQFKYLPAVRVLKFNVPILDFMTVLESLYESKIFKSIDFSHENYRVPFDFSSHVLVRDQGQIDADRYRSVTASLKKSGVVFGTQTTVPLDLQ